MKTHDFYYDLPPELIAQTPLERRDASRLLVLDRETVKAEPLTRAGLVSLLHAAEGSPVVNYLMDYSDVDQSAPYGEAVRWAASEQLVSG